MTGRILKILQGKNNLHDIKSNNNNYNNNIHGKDFNKRL